MCSWFVCYVIGIISSIIYTAAFLYFMYHDFNTDAGINILIICGYGLTIPVFLLYTNFCRMQHYGLLDTPRERETYITDAPMYVSIND
jgi:hypothetical protein